MKTRSIFEKLLSTNSTNCDADSGAREFVAEQLEARVLYSGAPAYLPQVEVAHEATNPAVEGNFESIDTFVAAAQNDVKSTNKSASETVVILTSFDDMAIEEPVTFDSAVAINVKRWDSSTAEVTPLATSPPVEFEIVILDKSDAITYPMGGEGVFVDEVQAQSRLTALRSTDGDHTFGLDLVKDGGSIFGLGQIERAMADVLTFAA